MAIQTGTVVQLKSGGPEMTVNGIIKDENNPIGKQIQIGLVMAGYSDGDVFCEWFDSDNKRQSGCFKAAMLDEVED